MQPRVAVFLGYLEDNQMFMKYVYTAVHNKWHDKQPERSNQCWNIYMRYKNIVSKNKYIMMDTEHIEEEQLILICL